MISNEEAHLNALKAELAYVKSQPNVREDRVADIEAEISQREPSEPEPAVETTEAPEVETAVPDKPKRRPRPDA